MIELAALEEMVAVKQLIAQGMQKGMEKGQFIGQIQLIQRLLKSPQTPNESLAILDVEELRTMLTNLEADLGLSHAPPKAPFADTPPNG